MKKIISILAIFFSLSSFSAESFTYFGASYSSQYVVSNNKVWNQLKSTMPSFTLGKRLHPLYAAELKYSSFAYNEGPSTTEPDIINSEFEVTRLALGIRVFMKNISFSLGYEYIDLSRKTTLADGSSIDPEFYAYDKTIHGVYATFGYQVFILNSIDLYSEIEAASNENYHSVSATVGFRFYPGGIFH